MSTFRKRTYAGYQKTPPGFKVRSTGHFQLNPPDHEARRVFDFCEIFWCVQGSGIYRLDGKEYHLQPDNVWYYPRGSLHNYDPAEPGFQYYWLVISGSCAPALFEGLGVKPGLNYGGSCPVHLFSHISSLLCDKSLEAGLEAISTAFEILCKISPDKKAENTQQTLAEKTRKIIDNQFTDPCFNVEELASRLGVHRSTVSRNFSQTWSVSVSNYIINCRIQYAMTLLNETNTSIQKIALESGFSSAAYFSRVFTARTGMTPAGFRRSKNLRPS